jgi:hypothetical protein
MLSVLLLLHRTARVARATSPFVRSACDAMRCRARVLVAAEEAGACVVGPGHARDTEAAEAEAVLRAGRAGLATGWVVDRRALVTADARCLASVLSYPVLCHGCALYAHVCGIVDGVVVLMGVVFQRGGAPCQSMVVIADGGCGSSEGC